MKKPLETTSNRIAPSQLDIIEGDDDAPRPITKQDEDALFEIEETISNITKTTQLEISKLDKKDSSDAYSCRLDRIFHDVLSESNQSEGDANNSSICDTNASICPSSKDRFSVKSSDTELAVARVVQAEDDKSIYAASEYDPFARVPLYKTRRCFVYTATAMVVISTIVAVVVVYASRATVKNDDNEILIQIPPTIEPTTDREYRVQTMIEHQVLQRDATFSNMKDEDPRYLALSWILRGDSQQLSVDDENLLQRYILAVFAFAFDIYNWSCGFIQGLDSCVGDNETSAADSSVWLSGTDECLWYGVSCVHGTVRELNMPYNNLIGEIPPELNRLQLLESIVLPENCLYGSIPNELLSLRSLMYLDLEKNALSGAIPTELYDASSLVSFKVGGNTNKITCNRTDGSVSLASDGLTGDILGPKISQLKHLEILSLYENQLSGTVNEGITDLRQLRELLVDSNKLHGELPSRIGDIHGLEQLSVWGMGMSGTLPDSIYNLTKLRGLYLQDNVPGFSGSIKSEIGNLNNLEQFWLGGNTLLSGLLPSELGRCENLSTIRLSNTQLSGTVPSEVCSLREKKLNNKYPGEVEYFKLDCAPNDNILPAQIECDCCQVCCDHTTKECINREA